MQEKLQELQAIVDAYMKENGIKEKERDNLLESVLLWNGYLKEDKPWEYETSQTNRAFCTYLEQENPSLFNYFERGLYLEDKDGETIDVSYMLGINKALNFRSYMQGEPEEALVYFVCAIPVFGPLFGRGGKWLKSAGRTWW